MLRVELDDSANVLSLKPQGRLVGEDAKNMHTLMARYRAGMRLVLDITEVTFVDAAGEDLLSVFGGFGAQFIAETSYSRDICERLHLPLACSQASDTANNHRPGTRTRISSDV